DDVGVEGPLGQEVDAAERTRLLLDYVDEDPPDDAPLLLRIDHTGQPLEEAAGRVHVLDAHVEAAVHHVEDALRLLAAQKAVVDEDAGQLVADGAVDEGRRHRAVDSAREGADDPSAPDRLPD